MSFPIFHNFGGLITDTAVQYVDEGTEEVGTTGTTWTTTTAWTTTGVTLVLIAGTSDDPDDAEATAVTGDPGGGNYAFTKLVGTISTAGVGRHPSVSIWIYDGALASETIKIDFSATTQRAAVTVVSLQNLQSTTAEDTDTAVGDAASLTMSALSAPSADGITLTMGNSVGGATYLTSDMETNLVSASPGTLTYSCDVSKSYDGSNVTYTKDTGTNDSVVAGVSLR